MLNEYEDLYVPQDEQALRRLQRKVDEVDHSVRAWAHAVLEVIPRGLSLLEDETYVLGLFLARQRRINAELDSQNPPPTLRSRLGQFLPLLAESPESGEVVRAAHKIVSTRLESDIDRACQFFCQDRGIPHTSDPAIDWRVAIRYLAQELHHVARGVDLRGDFDRSSKRYEMALLARDLAGEIVEKRRGMISAFAPSKESV